MLAGLDARQLSEMYAFAHIEPLDEPLQQMFAELTATLARVHGNDLKSTDFMLTRPEVEAAVIDDRALRSEQIAQVFARASKANEQETRPRRRRKKSC